MKIILSALLFIFIFHCKAQNNSDSEKGIYTFKENKSLVKNSKKFEKFNFNKAVKRFGEPHETRKIEITNETLSLFLSDDLIREHFPKIGDQLEEAYLLEATWKMLSASWITIWYKLEKNVWKPINVLVDL